MELRGQWGDSETNKINLMKLFALISLETKTMHKISSKAVYESIHIKMYLQ